MARSEKRVKKTKRVNRTKILSGLVLIAIVVFFVWYIARHISDFKELAIVGLSNIWLVLLVALIVLITFYLNGFLLDTLMRPFGFKLGFKESFGLAIITNFYNTITPFRGGMAARAVYLKKKYKFPYVHFLATLSAIYIIIFLIGSIAGLNSMIVIWYHYGLFNWIIFILFFALFIFLMLIIIFSPKFIERKNKWLSRFVKVINGWHLIKNNKKVVFTTAIVSLIQLILATTTLLINYSIFGIHLSFFAALFIASVNNLAILIAITPGNLGIGDAISVFSASIVGVGLTNAVAATILGRAISIIVISILGPIFSYRLMRNLKKKSKE
jgi:uncharacterized protein (TIRG00374 family)